MPSAKPILNMLRDFAKRLWMRMSSHSEHGRKGGLSRSDRKRQSSAANLRAARVKRWPGRELAKQPQQLPSAADLDKVAEEQKIADATALARPSYITASAAAAEKEDRLLCDLINRDLGLVDAHGRPQRKRLFNVEIVNEQ